MKSTDRLNKLLIVTGQLPVELTQRGDQVDAAIHYDDLTVAVSAFLRSITTWDQPVFSSIAWAGTAPCDPIVWDSVKDRLPPAGHLWNPVFLPVRHRSTISHGFANTVIWPLFHYFPSYVEFAPTAYENYVGMNSQFADSICDMVGPGATVWIHDYQLLPLAAQLRERIPDLSIGLFLHISFPSFQIFRHLPGTWQEEILKGMLGADLIGFQTNEYAALFRNCVRLTFGAGGNGETIEFENRLVKTGSFPVGIDFSRFDKAPEEVARTSETVAGFRSTFKDKQIVFSVDALDYTKGIRHRISAFEYFLRDNPGYLGKVILILVIIPSREDLSRYAERKKLIDEAVTEMNGRFGTLEWQPLFYMFKSLDLEELLTLYRLCDVALLTPLRDAMNLYAKQFVASRHAENGVLILSELDGAADQLAEALAVNPNDVPNIAHAILTALEMPAAEQRTRMQAMRQTVRIHDIAAWGRAFLLALEGTRSGRKISQGRLFE